MTDKRRILVVDDDSKSRRIFEAHLTAMGFEAVLSNNGEEAMELLAEDSYFDLIITDVISTREILSRRGYAINRHKKAFSGDGRV